MYDINFPSRDNDIDCNFNTFQIFDMKIDCTIKNGDV